MLRKVGVILIVLFLSFIVISSGYAQEFKEPRIRIGGGTLATSLKIEQQFDSNIFLTAGDRKSDSINVVTPKLVLDMPFGLEGRHSAQLSYKAEIGSFADYSNQDYVNQDINGNLTLNLPKGYFTLKDLFRKTVDRSATEFTSLVRRMENKPEFLLGVEINRLTYELGYSQFTRKYSDEIYNTLDYSEDMYSFTGYYQLFPKTQALLEYDHGIIDYSKDSTRDGDYNQVRVGFKGELTGKTVGLVKLGYQARDYDTAGKTGFDNFVAECGVTTKLSERTQLDLIYNRTAIESTYTPNNYYDTNAVSLILTQKLIGNFSARGSFNFDRNEYPEADTTGKKRRDTIWTGKLGLGYDIKDWVKAEISYEYKEDVSNIDIKDYNRNLTSISLTFLL